MSRHSPNFESEDDAIRAYIASGRIAMHWGLVEQLLENIIILTRFHQDENPSKPFPHSFSKKIEEIKSRLNDKRISDEQENEIRVAISKGKRLHSIRTVVVHGTCQGLRIDGRIEFGMSHQKKGIAYTPVYFTFEELEESAEDMLDSHQNLSAIFRALQNTLVGKHVPDPKR
ncbi:MAG: hypothetical protein VYD64_10815 [Pseudomonadota bacterium]|nr:hypothetical protein [Pseudomonadota bacterium]